MAKAYDIFNLIKRKDVHTKTKIIWKLVRIIEDIPSHKKLPKVSCTCIIGPWHLSCLFF